MLGLFSVLSGRRGWPGRFLALFFLFNLFVSLTASAAWPTDYAGMTTKSKHFAGRILCLVEKIYPYIVMIYFTIGGLKYLLAEDPSEALAARKGVFDAFIAAVCILIFLGAAEALGVPVYCDDY